MNIFKLIGHAVKSDYSSYKMKKSNQEEAKNDYVDALISGASLKSGIEREKNISKARDAYIKSMISAKVGFNKADTSEKKLNEQLRRIDKSIDKIHKKYFSNQKTYGGNMSSEARAIALKGKAYQWFSGCAAMAR